MQISTLNVPLGWQTAIDGQTFGPAMQRTTDLWAWQKAVLMRGDISPEDMALIGLVLEHTINQTAKVGDTTMHALACTLLHNLSFRD